MVFKTPTSQYGRHYGKDNDQYDDESIGSTKTATNSVKFVEKSTEKGKIEGNKKMCSKQQEENNEKEWTTIEANSKRKPKSNSNKNTTMDTIISSIDVDFNIDKNGLLKARIDSPKRNNRCNIPDTQEYTSKQVKENKELLVTTLALNEQSEKERMATVGQTNNGNDESNKNVENSNNNNNNNKNNKNMNNDNGNSSRNDKDNNNNNNNSNSNKAGVTIMEPTDMSTYTFTISWRPDQKVGKDGKIIIKSLMREMVHKVPQIIFHPTTTATSPVPKDIHNINNDFPTTPAKYDDFFDQMRNRDGTNQKTYMKVTMPHDEKELQRKLHNYLKHNKLYMNSPFIDDNTLEQVGFIENGHSRLVYRPTLEKKINEGLKLVMNGDQLTPQQGAQLKHLSSEIRVGCHRGTVRAGPYNNQVVCEGIVLKTAKSQTKIAMELLSMLPDDILGEQYKIIPKSIETLVGYELYGRIVADTVTFQDTLRPITIMYCDTSVFEDDYSVKIQNSNHVTVQKFIMDCCGAISIEETNETKEKGKYIVVVPDEKVESARKAIGTMFQEFQFSGGRPSAIACLEKYQNYPLVNDNVTISGHAQLLSEKIRRRYQNKPKTPVKHRPSSASYSYHGEGMNTNAHEPPPVPQSIRGIVKGTRANAYNTKLPVQQWALSPPAKQSATTTTSPVEDRTVMSNLSPDDSAKTMMTNVSKMVESLGTVVNTMAKENSNTNETIKQMMLQQATTINNLMIIMTRNEDRRQGIPISEIQQPQEPNMSTPVSTLTNSQYSQSQEQPTSANKRKYGTTDEETTAISTVESDTVEGTEEGEQDNMVEEQMDVINNEQTIDVTMEDNDQTEDETTNTTMAAGDFSQFNIRSQHNNNNKETNSTNTSAKTDMNSSNE